MSCVDRPVAGQRGERRYADGAGQPHVGIPQTPVDVGRLERALSGPDRRGRSTGARPFFWRFLPARHPFTTAGPCTAPCPTAVTTAASASTPSTWRRTRARPSMTGTPRFSSAGSTPSGISGRTYRQRVTSNPRPWNGSGNWIDRFARPWDSPVRDRLAPHRSSSSRCRERVRMPFDRPLAPSSTRTTGSSNR